MLFVFSFNIVYGHIIELVRYSFTINNFQKFKSIPIYSVEIGRLTEAKKKKKKTKNIRAFKRVSAVSVIVYMYDGSSSWSPPIESNSLSDTSRFISILPSLFLFLFSLLFSSFWRLNWKDVDYLIPCPVFTLSLRTHTLASPIERWMKWAIKRTPFFFSIDTQFLCEFSIFFFCWSVRSRAYQRTEIIFPISVECTKSSNRQNTAADITYARTHKMNLHSWLRMGLFWQSGA